MYVRYIDKNSGEPIVSGHGAVVPAKGEFVTIAGTVYQVHKRHWHPVEHFVEIELKG